MTPHELRATLDRLDLSAAEAGHLLGVHRATIYRWLDGSMSVPIVVEVERVVDDDSNPGIRTEAAIQYTDPVGTVARRVLAGSFRGLKQAMSGEIACHFASRIVRRLVCPARL